MMLRIDFLWRAKHMSKQALFLSRIIMQFRLRYFYLSIFIYIIFAKTQTWKQAYVIMHAAICIAKIPLNPSLCLRPFPRDHNCSHYDHADGKRPLLPPSSISHQGTRRLLLDLLRVCVCGAHWVCLRSLQRRLPTQGKGQSEGQQAQLRGEINIPTIYSQIRRQRCTASGVGVYVYVGE